MFSNFKLNGKMLDLELKEPFSTFAKISDQPKWLPASNYLRTFEFEPLMPPRMQQHVAKINYATC